MARTSSLSEKPISDKPRRLADWLNPTGEKKVHSLIDKVYKQKNLELAWDKVRRNKGAGGIDGQSITEFESNSGEYLARLHDELRTKTYEPQPVKQQLIPKSGQPGKFRPLGIPTVYDRICQQALLNRLEPIFEPIFDDANFGYRRGRSTKDAMRKIWKEIEAGNEWIVDADLKDFFGSACHQKVLTLFGQRIADGRILSLLDAIMKAGCIAEGKKLPTDRGVPQGGVFSPLASNVLLTPFDREMRRKGYRLTRYADDWLVTCSTRAEAQAALDFATKVLSQLGVTLNKEKTRIVHVRRGFEFLGYKIKRGAKPLRLPSHKIKSGTKQGALYVYPRQKSLTHFREQIRSRTQRRSPRNTQEIVDAINPVIRGWGNYYRKAHIRKLFAMLDRWIMRRLWSQRYKRWRNSGWKTLPMSKLREELGLVSLIRLIPSLNLR
jgi:group II intron reverse transcriptase/maturase